MTVDPGPPKSTPEDKRRASITLGVLGLSLLGLSMSRCSPRSDTASPAPAPPTYLTAAKELVRQRLRDPSSAEFSDARIITGRSDQPTTVCGRVNAKNGFGGMTGAKRFIVGGTVVLEDEIGAADMSKIWATFC